MAVMIWREFSSVEEVSECLTGDKNISEARIKNNNGVWVLSVMYKDEIIYDPNSWYS